MAKFIILITRDVTESTRVDVEAETQTEAIAKALREAREAPHEFDWTRDDCIGGEPYHAGGDECPVCDGTGALPANADTW